MMEAHLLAPTLITDDALTLLDLEAQQQETLNFDADNDVSSDITDMSIRSSSTNINSSSSTIDASSHIPDSQYAIDSEGNARSSTKVEHVVTNNVSVTRIGRSISRRQDDRQEYRGRSPQVVRTHRPFHDACRSRKSNLEALQEMLLKDTSLAWLAFSTRPSVKALVPMQIIALNYDFILKNSVQSEFDSFLLALFQLYPNSIARRDNALNFPFIGVVKEWLSICAIKESDKDRIEETDLLKKKQEDKLQRLSEYSLHILSLFLDDLEESDCYNDDGKGLISQVIDEFTPLVPCFFRTISVIKDDCVRHRIFRFPLIHRVLVACAPDCFKDGKHPLHLVAEKASLLAKTPYDLKPVIRDLVTRSPMILVVADNNGHIPFESNIREWVNSHSWNTPNAGDDNEKKSLVIESSYSRATFKCGVCSLDCPTANKSCYRDLKFTFQLLSSISTEVLPESLASSPNKEIQVETVLSVLTKSIASIPSLTLTLLSIIKQHGVVDEIFSTEIMSKVLSHREHLQDGWANKALEQGMIGEVISYLEQLAICLPIETCFETLIQDREFLKQAARFGYQDNLILSSRSFHQLLDQALFHRIPILMLIIDTIFMILLLIGHGLYVDSWIQGRSSVASISFFPTVTLSLYFLCRRLGNLSHSCCSIMKNNTINVSSWKFTDALGCVWLLYTIISAESSRGERNETIQICLALSSFYLWLKILFMFEVFSVRLATVRLILWDIVKMLMPFVAIGAFILASFAQVLYVITSSKSQHKCSDSDDILCDVSYHILNSISFALGTIIWNDYRKSGVSVVFVCIFSIIFIATFFGSVCFTAKYAYDLFQNKHWLSKESNRFVYGRLLYIIDLHSCERVLKEGIKFELTRLTLNNLLQFFAIAIFITTESSAVIQFKGNIEELMLGSLLSTFGIVFVITLLWLVSRMPTCVLSKPLLKYTHQWLCLPLLPRAEDHQVRNDIFNGAVSDQIMDSVRNIVKDELRRSEKRFNLILKSEMQDCISRMEQGVNKKCDIGSI